MATGDLPAPTDAELALVAELARVFAPERAGTDAALAALGDLSIEDVRAWRAVASPAEIVEALALEESVEGGAAAWESLQARGALSLDEGADEATRAFVHPELRPARWSGASVALARREGRTLVVFEGARSSDGPDELGRGERSHVVEHRALFARPLGATDALLIASDLRGVTTAEALAREHAARMIPWGQPSAPPRALWRVIGAGDSMSVDEVWSAPQPPRGLGVALGSSLGRVDVGRLLRHLDGPLWRDEEPGMRDRRAVRRFARQQFELALAWLDLASSGARVPGLDEVPSSLIGAPFAALPDPFEPLRALWTTGYVLQGLYEEGAVLLAPREAEPVAEVRSAPRYPRYA